MNSVAHKAVERCSGLFKNHLLATNLAISFTLSGLGDLLQQRYEKKAQIRQSLNVQRTLQMSTSFGLTSGFMCHFWYNFLDRLIPGSGVRIVLRKILYDQVIFSPVCISVCLVSCGVIEKKALKQIKGDLWNIGVPLYAAEWVLWPPAQFVNFYFLPTRYRVIFDNFVSLIYDTYTSHVKHSKGGGEESDHSFGPTGDLRSIKF